jgi:hypothetical protein
MGAVLLVAVGATSWVLLKRPVVTPRAANITAAQPAAASACASAVVYGPAPDMGALGVQSAEHRHAARARRARLLSSAYPSARIAPGEPSTATRAALRRL